MNKNNGILFLALAAIGAGLYFMFAGRKTEVRTQTGTTGTNPYAPANSFAQLVGQRASSVRIPGASGASVDLSGPVTAGINTLGTLAGKAIDAILRQGQPSNTRQGTPDDGYGWVFDDYNLYKDPTYSGNSEGGGFQGPVWEIPDSVEYASPGYGHDDWGNQQWESTPIEPGGAFDNAYGGSTDTIWI